MLQVATCHAGLGVRVVLVIGARQQIDELLTKQGESPQYTAGYRVTDAVAMQTVVQACGASRMVVEAQLSKVLTPLSVTQANPDSVHTDVLQCYRIMLPRHFLLQPVRSLAGGNL